MSATFETPIFDACFAEADATTRQLVLVAIADKPHREPPATAIGKWAAMVARSLQAVEVQS